MYKYISLIYRDIPGLVLRAYSLRRAGEIYTVPGIELRLIVCKASSLLPSPRPGVGFEVPWRFSYLAHIQ